jgi:hypothetical protein
MMNAFLDLNTLRHNSRLMTEPLSPARISLILLARPERFELPTTWFEARCSIQLSYGRVGGKFSGFAPRAEAAVPGGASTAGGSAPELNRLCQAQMRQLSSTYALAGRCWRQAPSRP